MSCASHENARHIAGVVFQTVLCWLLGMAFASEAVAATPFMTAVPVRQASRQCFVRSVYALGYIVPRAVAVVMFNAPDFRISDVLVKPGDVVERDQVVAKAVAATPRSGGPSSNTKVSIHSLAPGLILKSTAFVGMATSAQTEPLFTLALGGDLEAMVDVPGIHVFELESGQIAHVSLRDGTVLDGHLRLAPVVIDSATQTGQARIAFAAGTHVPLGRFVRAKIEANRSCGVGVPLAAVNKSSEGPQIQIVDGDIVATRTVELGLSNESAVEVTNGLHEGELVVANAGAALRDGDRIKPILVDAQDGP